MNVFHKKISEGWVHILIGALMVIGGFFLMTQPVGTFVGLSIIFGWSIFVFGGINLVFALRNRQKFDDWVWYLMIGILEMLLGAALLFQPELSAQALIIFTGFWLLFGSASRIGFSFILKKLGVTNWWLTLLSGIVTALFSFLIIINPIFGMISVVYLVAIPIVIFGFLTILFGIQIRKINMNV